MFDKDGTQVRDLTSDMTFNIVALDDYDVIVYTAQFGYAQELPIGQYYISVSDGAQTWYSDIFTIVSDITPYVKLEWYDEENFVMDAGTIIYNNPRFINRLYLNTEIGKPDYQFEEEGEQRDGYFFPEKQLSEKTYRFTILAPEYLCDVMRFIRMADHIQITADGYTYNADTFLITPKWQTQGDLASVEVEFESNTVAKKLGDARVRRTIGDFNDDYNDDYDGGDTPVPPTPTEAPENDVNFYDYDGFRVASYTIAEAKALTELPTPPTHQGLTFKEWNWSLADIQSYNRRYIDIGANYEPTDGKCHIKVRIEEEGGEYLMTTAQNVYTIPTSIDWDDGTIETLSNSMTHIYAQAGVYDIKIYPNSPTTSHYLQINFQYWVQANVQYIGMVEEINLASFVDNCILTYLDCKISFPTYAKIGGYYLSNCKVPNVVFPKLMEMSNTPTLNLFRGRLCLPKTLTTLNITILNNALFERFVYPEYTNGSSITNIQYWTWCKVLSLPLSLNFTGANFLQGFYYLRVLDVPQGFVPTNTMNLSMSNFWQSKDIVDFFNKLGTTSTAITLTWGTANLDKLTADEKAIATNKGYTLA